jgi:hypothetical protein
MPIGTSMSAAGSGNLDVLGDESLSPRRLAIAGNEG